MLAKYVCMIAILGSTLAEELKHVTPQAQSVCDEIYELAPSNLAFSPFSSTASKNSVTLNSLYHSTPTTYWDNANEADYPACMLFPSCAEEVSAGVIALGKQPDVPFAIKSGGHNWNRGFSSTNGGVLMSFRPYLSNTTLATDGQTAKVGPGARWQEVIEALDESNKCVVGGRAGDVGVGGYIVQGGISYLTAQHGFACDNVAEYEFVTANGTILNVSNETHSDIYWALRGGGNAFGIVTMLTLRAYDMNDIWGGELFYSPDQLSEFNLAVSEFTANNKDPRAAIVGNYAIVEEGLPQSVSVSIFYDGPLPSSNVFEPFESITPHNGTLKRQRYKDLLDSLSNSTLGLRTTNAVNSFPNMPRSNMSSFLDWQWNEFAESNIIRSTEQYGILAVAMALQPIPVGLQQASLASGPGALSLDPQNGDKLWIEYDIGWHNSSCDKECPTELIRLVDSSFEYEKRTFAGVRPTHYVSGNLSFVPYNPLFMNDAHFSQGVLRSYGQETFDRLITLHHELDPNQFFTSRQKGFFFN